MWKIFFLAYISSKYINYVDMYVLIKLPSAVLRLVFAPSISMLHIAVAIVSSPLFPTLTFFTIQSRIDAPNRSWIVTTGAETWLQRLRS